MNLDGFPGGINPPPNPLERKHINVKGRKEHEEWLRNPQKMREHGLDPVYETLIYLKRWGGYLDEQEG